MKKLKVLALAMLSVYGATAGKKDEGMWLPLLLKTYNYSDMQQMGLKLTPEQLYDINNSSLKDAIVSFGGFCTGEIVSNEGLVLTNHHCGYSSIQSNSTTENNLLANGFWAKDRSQELKNPGLYVKILVRIDDVTVKVKEALNGVEEKDRTNKLRGLYKELETSAVEGTHYVAELKEMFNGGEYYIFVYEKFTDIRLVGNPPESIGKFGGDTDNWMWPRHTGDFSVFRIYAGKDNKPAPYSPENVPYKPKHFLPVSVKGVQPGDFTMTYGYPGRTSRYLTSYGIKLAIEETNPAVIKILGKRLEIMKAAMDADPRVRLALASNYASLANSYKYYVGQTEGLKRLGLLEQKQADETKFTEWVNQSEERKTTYGDALRSIGAAYGNLRGVNLPSIYLRQTLIGSRTIGIAQSFKSLVEDLKTSKNKLSAEQLEKFRKQADEMYEDYNAAVEQEILANMLDLYVESIPADQQNPYVQEILKKYKGATWLASFQKFAAKTFEKSVFSTKEKFLAFLAKPDGKKLEKDPLFVYYDRMTAGMDNITGQVTSASATISRQSQLLIQGMREMQPQKHFYPDANSSLRLSYGKVINYSPADAVEYDYITTMKGIMEKEDPADPEEFTVEPKLKALYKSKDFGMYAMPNGEMPVAFISDNDITGGNSGSPVINGNGQLVGIAFDGNWEAMTGDIVYDKDLKRCINVDIRYVLFIIDKFGGASHLIQEMQVVR